MMSLQRHVGESPLVILLIIQEGRGSGEKNVGKDSQGPNVGLPGDVFILNNLWCNELSSANHRPDTDLINKIHSLDFLLAYSKPTPGLSSSELPKSIILMLVPPFNVNTMFSG